MRLEPRIDEAVIKVACTTCPRTRKYRGYAPIKEEAEDKAFDEALKDGWMIVGGKLHCPACVRAGRAEQEEG